MYIVDFINHYATQPSIVVWVLYAILLLFFFTRILFYIIIYKRPYRYEKKRLDLAIREDELPGVSVIITSKNGAEALEKNLPLILNQDYPNYEVIVINRGSTDETDMVLKAAEQRFPHLYHTYVPDGANEKNEKKLALTLGIKAAKNEVLLFTEAYCTPCSSRWIWEFGKEFTQGSDVVLGYNQLRFNNKITSQKFIWYDNLTHHMQFLSMAIAKKPFMGIGRNMAYKKSLYFEQKGFSTILNIDGGEDDLFLNRTARNKKTGVVLSNDSMTETDIVDSFSTWRLLKSKYNYTRQFYKGFSTYLFGWDTVSKYIFYIIFIILLLFGITTKDIIAIGASFSIFIINFMIHLNIINQNSNMMGETKYHINLILFDIIHPIINHQFKTFANRRNKRNFS